MKKDTLIEHKEDTIVCKESGHASLSYNALLTTLKANINIKLIVVVVKIKSTLIYTNCGKIGHTFETCHNWKRETYQ
jgi:hypothetical protein